MLRKYIKEKMPVIFELYMFGKAFLQVKKNKNKQTLTLDEIIKKDEMLYFQRQGRKLDWDHLITYTEKMQWAKIYDTDPRKVVCADKYAVREFVKGRIGDKYLVPIIGVWNRLQDVRISKLPEKFVLKTNHGSGDAIIVENKKELTLAEKIEIYRRLYLNLSIDYSAYFCEMHYKDIKPKIIAEEVLQPKDAQLYDYKFLCFDGIPYYCCVDADRFSGHKRNIYDMDWELQDWTTNEKFDHIEEVSKPECFDEMKELASKLSEGFSHVRVDFYNFDKKVYFGEMTFTSAAGFHKFYPYEADVKLGTLWNIR